MTPEPWQQLVLDTLRELSDAAFQERAWLRHESNEISSPIEIVNQLFDDSGLIGLLERGGIVFSVETDEKLKQLSAYVDMLDLERSAADLLSDCRWQHVRELASQARTDVKEALERRL